MVNLSSTALTQRFAHDSWSKASRSVSFSTRPGGGGGFSDLPVPSAGGTDDPPDHSRARGRRRRAHHRGYRRGPGSLPAPAPSSRPRAGALSASSRPRAASGFRSRRRPRTRSRCSSTCGAWPGSATTNVALVHARSRAPAWVALGAARSLEHPLRDHLSRQLCRPVLGEGALQFRDGARRRGHRQFALHRRPRSAPCIPRRAAGSASSIAAPIFRSSRRRPSRRSGWRSCAGTGASPRTSGWCCSPPG